MTDEAKRALEKLRGLGFTNEEGAIEWALNLLLVVEKLPPGFGLTVGRTGQNDCYFAEVRDTDTELLQGTAPRHLSLSDDLDTAAEVALLRFKDEYPRPVEIPAGDVLGELPDAS